MRYYRTWIIAILILALPIASMATISNIHCMDKSESISLKAELKLAESSLADHCDRSDVNQAANDSTLPTDCSCDCNDNLGCLNSIGNSFALTSNMNLSITSSDSQIYLNQSDQFASFHPPPLIRPPIIIS